MGSMSQMLAAASEEDLLHLLRQLRQEAVRVGWSLDELVALIRVAPPPASTFAAQQWNWADHTPVLPVIVVDEQEGLCGG